MTRVLTGIDYWSIGCAIAIDHAEQIRERQPVCEVVSSDYCYVCRDLFLLNETEILTNGECICLACLADLDAAEARDKAQSEKEDQEINYEHS